MKQVNKNRVLIVSIMILMLGTLLIQSCEKDPKNPPPPKTYTLSSVVSGKGLLTPDKKTNINPGSVLKLVFSPDSTYSLHKAKINGLEIKEIPESETDVHYQTIVNSDLFIEANFVKTNILVFSVETLSEKPWMLTSIDDYDFETGEFIESMPLSESEKTAKHYFLYPSMQLVFTWQDGSVTTGKWDLRDNTLKMNSDTVTIVKLTKDEMKYKTGPLPGGFGGPIDVVRSFKR